MKRLFLSILVSLISFTSLSALELGSIKSHGLAPVALKLGRHDSWHSEPGLDPGSSPTRLRPGSLRSSHSEGEDHTALRGEGTTRAPVIEKFMDNAALDGWSRATNEILFMRKDKSGTFQLFKVREDASEPEKEKVCLSCAPLRAIGLQISTIPLLHKGASDWHPSGEWFITQMEVPDNIGWKQMKRAPVTRTLAEPGRAGGTTSFL